MFLQLFMCCRYWCSVVTGMTCAVIFLVVIVLKIQNSMSEAVVNKVQLDVG